MTHASGPLPWRRALTRRRFAGSLGVAAAATLTGPALAPVARAAATRNAGPVVIYFRPGYNASTPVVTEVFQRALEPFHAQHPGIEVRLVFYNPGVGGWTSEILAGTAPDVFEFYLFNDLASGGYLLDLTPYVKQSNVDLSVFPSTQIDFFTLNGQLLGLPVTNEWNAAVINLTMLDNLGLKYPDPTWTVQEAADLYRKLAKPNPDPTKAVYGGHFWMYYSNTPTAEHLAPFGASVVDPNNRARSGVGTPEMIAATTYMADLIQSRVCSWDNTLGWTQFLAGQIGVALVGDWFLVQVAQAAQTAGFKFDFWPLPAGPKGGATYGSEAYYAIPSTTRNPDAAWALLEYVATTRYIPDVMLNLWLYPPPTVSLGGEYLARIRQLAPPLRDKNLSAFTYWTNHAVQVPFKYEDAQAENIVSNYFGQVWNAKLSPIAALTAAAKQVDALEAVGAVAEAQQAAALRKLEALNTSPQPVALAAPPVAGSGVAAKAAPSQAVLNTPPGTYTLLGTGNDVWNASDNCTYACAPTQSSVQTFVCRLVALSNVSCPHLSPWAKVGLMARGDLSDDAAMVWLGATGGNGLAIEVRPMAAGQPGNENGDGGATGLMAAPYVTSNPALAAPNYLLRPIWLKLERRGITWTGYSSLDGVHWAQAGRSVAVEMASAWIGLFACAHNSDFNGQGYIRAVFDHVSFTPQAVYQVGQAGAPPAAGAVPANWATLTAPVAAAPAASG